MQFSCASAAYLVTISILIHDAIGSSGVIESTLSTSVVPKISSLPSTPSELSTLQISTLINPSQVASVTTSGGYKFGHLPMGITYYGNPPQIKPLVVADGAVGKPNIVSMAVVEQTASANVIQGSAATRASTELRAGYNGATSATNGGLAYAHYQLLRCIEH